MGFTVKPLYMESRLGMNTMRKKPGVLWSTVIPLLLMTWINAGVAMAIEEPDYDILEQVDDFELRRYDSYIVAETLIEEAFDDAGNEGFRRLFAYISGQNRKKASISMTAPVSQEQNAEKIDMTAPVNQQREAGKWRVTFMMPSEYTLETLPEPLDHRVKLKKVEGRLVAALKYSGTWSKKRYEKKKERLESLIEQRGLTPMGEPVFARYNPPFMPWFLRRNEVIIPVVKNGNLPIKSN
jgi:hypothetical protein